MPRQEFRPAPIIGGAGLVASLGLAVGELGELGGRRFALAVGVLTVGAVAGAYALLVFEALTPGIAAVVFLGVMSAGLASGVAIPPGSSLPPPGWPMVVAAAAVVALRFGPAVGLAAGVVAGCVPIVVAAQTLDVLTTRVTAQEIAFLVLSVAPALAAGTLNRSARV